MTTTYTDIFLIHIYGHEGSHQPQMDIIQLSIKNRATKNTSGEGRIRIIIYEPHFQDKYETQFRVRRFIYLWVQYDYFDNEQP